MQEQNFLSIAQELVTIGKNFADLGWVPATSGNFSAIIDLEWIAITESGHHKGELTPEAIMVVDRSGRACEPHRKPSAETLLHTMLYQQFPELQCVLHIHSPNATVLSKQLYREGKMLLLEDYEVFKIFRGIDTHETSIQIPVFANDQNIERLSQVVQNYLLEHPKTYGFLISGHGLYTYAESISLARYYTESLDFLFGCELTSRSISR